MVFKRTESLRAIADGLGRIVHACELQGMLQLFDDHIQAQHFFWRLLNAAYGLELGQMDQIQANYPAIDLGDPVNRVAYQVTSEKSGDKVQHTLDKFVEHGLHATYDTLKILVIGDRQATYKAVKVPAELSFDCDCDILGITDLVKHLNTLPSRCLEEIEAIMREELVAVPQLLKSQKEEIEEWLQANALIEPLSQVLPKVMRLAQLVGNTDVERWARLELFGYNKEGRMQESDDVPEYRTVVGRHYDHFNEPLLVQGDLHLLNCHRLRYGVGTLEDFAKQNQMHSIADPVMIDILRKHLGVEFARFCFSHIAITNVINAIRPQLLDKIPELEQ